MKLAAVNFTSDLAVLKEITNRKRDRLWSAPDVFEVIDSLEKRIGRRKLPRLR